MPAKDAIEGYAEIVPNPPGWNFVMAFDIDGGAGEDAWREAGICQPNFVVGRAGSGRCHFIYVLKMGVMRANRKAAKYFDAVRRAYTAALMPYGADPAYRGYSVHNPRARMYAQVCLREAPYDLDELAVHADFNAPLPEALRQWHGTAPRATGDVGIGSRNVAIFDVTRHAAYPVARAGGEAVAIERAAKAAALAYNEALEAPLGEREVLWIVSSVVRWCSRAFRGVRGSGTRAPRAPRGAVDRSTWRKQAALRAGAAVKLRALGRTTVAIAQELGVSVRSVMRYLAQQRGRVTVKRDRDKCGSVSGVEPFRMPERHLVRSHLGAGRKILGSFPLLILEKIRHGWIEMRPIYEKRPNGSFKRCVAEHYRS